MGKRGGSRHTGHSMPSATPSRVNFPRASSTYGADAAGSEEEAEDDDEDEENEDEEEEEEEAGDGSPPPVSLLVLSMNRA